LNSFLRNELNKSKRSALFAPQQTQECASGTKKSKLLLIVVILLCTVTRSARAVCSEGVGTRQTEWIMDLTVKLEKEIAERKRAETGLRASEERFRQITDNIKEVFWMTNVEKSQMIYISPGYEAIWGRSCRSLYENPRSWLDAIDP